MHKFAYWLFGFTSTICFVILGGITFKNSISFNTSKNSITYGGKVIEKDNSRTEYHGLTTIKPDFNNKEIIKINEPCEFVRSGNKKDYDPTLVANSLFLANLECYKTNPKVEEQMKIKDYIFDQTNGLYSIKVNNPDNSNRTAGDGIIEGDWVTGKHFMFISLIQSGGYIYMNHGTGP